MCGCLARWQLFMITGNTIIEMRELLLFQVRMRLSQDKRTSNSWGTRLPRMQFGTSLLALHPAYGFATVNHLTCQNGRLTSTFVN